MAKAQFKNEVQAQAVITDSAVDGAGLHPFDIIDKIRQLEITTAAKTQGLSDSSSPTGAISDYVSKELLQLHPEGDATDRGVSGLDDHEFIEYSTLGHKEFISYNLDPSSPAA